MLTKKFWTLNRRLQVMNSFRGLMYACRESEPEGDYLGPDQAEERAEYEGWKVKNPKDINLGDDHKLSIFG